MLKKFKRIYDLRVDNDLTQKDMAKILNTTRDNYAQWERGFCNFPLEKINIFANYFNVSLDYLTGLSNNKKTENYQVPNFNDIPSKIKNIRKKYKYTQEKISEIIKIKQRTYSGYETGRSQTPLYVLYLLARTYNISLDYLISRSENKIRKENNYGFRKR